MRGNAERPEVIAARWHAQGVAEVIVKMGPEGAYVSIDGAGNVVATTPVVPVDTSGAGDAFDAGYIAARLAGHGAIDAAKFGHKLAGETVKHRGAIPARHATAHIQLGRPC